MQPVNTCDPARPLVWRHLYREAELYKAALRVYTKPLFQWRKALHTSTDGRTLYDLAARGLRGLEALDRSLRNQTFSFRPSIGLKYNFNGKRRTLYIPPWEERIVDLLLYRLLNRRLHHWFSRHSYAYRDRAFSLDQCQTRIAHVLRSQCVPLYIVKRDVTDYFASVNHELLLQKLEQLVAPGDYLFQLLQQRVRFAYQDEEGAHEALVGIPFGCASACLFANIYLTELDRAIGQAPGVSYFRYADDILLISSSNEKVVEAAKRLEHMLSNLRLTTKLSHQADLVLSSRPQPDQRFAGAREFRHLGLLFRSGGAVALSRDKQRKIQNLFRFAFRRRRGRWRNISGSVERVRTLVAIAAEVVEKGVRNVAILDYYLKHVSEEEQLRMLDLWLAEEVLSLVFGGHKKGHFAKISFAELRRMGLPSLVHRRRSISAGRIESPFFIWQQQKTRRAFKGTVARLRPLTQGMAFSPLPEAAASKCP
jgi:Reverse transcriptase (RNA-dependent DNA polymerase)